MKLPILRRRIRLGPKIAAGGFLMKDLPEGLIRGEPARLFPVLADTSKEGRSTSIFLACLGSVREYAHVLLATVGQRLGPRAGVRTYTEIGFAQGDDPSSQRPDGLVVVAIGKREWKALVEAKIGNVALNQEQVERYLELARKNRADAVITISNQFTATPSHHPLSLPSKGKAKSKVELYHWSWMFLLTQADLLLSNEDVADDDQRFILREMVRFLTHDSAGVKGFDRMPPAWSDLVQRVGAGAQLSAKAAEVEEVIGAWHQEVRDLALILSRMVGVAVDVKLPRAHLADHTARVRADAEELASSHTLSARVAVPDAAAPIEICADASRRTLSASMVLRAPTDRKSAKARLNWLLRQLQKTPPEDLHIRLHWQGRGPHTQHPLGELQQDADIAVREQGDKQLHTFEVCGVWQLGGRFGQRKNFVADLENLVPGFYQHVGQHLKAHQPPAPRVREERPEADGIDAIEEQVEAAAEAERRGT